MNWNQIDKLQKLDEIRNESLQQPILIFKHSTRCSTSRMSLDRLERNWNEAELSDVKPYFLDLLSYREISNKIAEIFGVQHESPQVILVIGGEAVLDLSHFEIEYDQIRQFVKKRN
ncbi:MAG TPA: bacillithiol system redox-active protein YtxJ [Chryseosolibacter sp.]|nr:bacillithiol system redox-active protein YtxJ [Chryseosolibacter sp.]